MNIERLIIKKPLRYLWLKSVTGINLNVHCAKCLEGEYSKLVNNRITDYYNLDVKHSPTGIYYLCGVSKPYVWENNFHFALIESNESIEVDNDLVYLKANNCSLINFSENDIPVELKSNVSKAYYTCRNWQFANKLANTPELL